ncbi:MAG TPA: oxygenase MpaB family protein [Candidatus Dormibacteraeota bacterium]|nr:oxygenase MpaB family protein [Candidatus Dormibacteraeota bacterium]
MTVAERAEVDFGLFGPGSMAWRLHREPALLVGGLRALMVQALHPLAIAAVADHSDYRSDVWGRYARTTNYVTTTIFGTTRQAQALGARVREIHRPIRGVDRVTGRPYAADDPVLLLWIHTTLVDSFLAAYRRFVGPLDPDDADRYVAEMVRQAELVGLCAEQVPSDERANRAFIDGCRPELRLTEAAVEAAQTVLRPPLPLWRRPLWTVLGQAAISIMPEDALALYGMRRHPAAEAAVRPLVRVGTQLARRFLSPPPVIVAAARRARAAGRSFP